MVASGRLLRGCALAGLCCLFGRVAYGQESHRIVVDCALLDAERSAEVEARVRATLLTARLPEARVTISCTTASAQVEVEAGARAARVTVDAQPPELQVRLLDAVDRALSELEQPEQAESVAPVEPVHEPRPALPAALPPPLSASPSPSSTPPPLASPPVPPVPAVLEVAGLGRVEAWAEGLAVGGEVGSSYGAGALRAGVIMGVMTLTPRDTAFGVREWNAALELDWQPWWAYGVRAGLGLGASVLAVAPRADLTPRHGTSTSAAVAELSCSRPVWIGKHWAIAPRLAGRFFGAKRRVNVNDAQALALGGVAPSFGLLVVYRLE